MSHEHSEEGQKTDWKQYALLAGLGIMLVLGVVQAIQIGNLQAKVGGGTALASASSQPQGETQAQMMARMHPDQVQPAAASGGARQVGGC